MKTGRKLLTLVILVIGLVIFPNVAGQVTAAGPPGHVTTWYVATTGDDSNDCLSPATACKTIQAAVNKAADGDTISVAAGTYPGAVNLSQRENLRIIGASSAAITDPGLPLGAAVVNVQLSRSITFEDLTISGNPNGVEAMRIFDSLVVRVRRCTIEQANLGFFINGQSTVGIEASTIQDNSTGIRVDGSSAVSLNSTPFGTGTSTVQRNGSGVTVRSGSFFLHGATIVQENGVGINGDGGLVKVCCQEGGLRKISNNVTGIQLRGSSLDLRGPLEMTGNQGFAIIQFGGFARISGRVTLQNNGGPQGSAIVTIGGHLQLEGGQANNTIEISNNPGSGVILTDSASARILNTLISNNGVHGVRVQGLSSIRLFNTAIMRDNGGLDLSCAPDSFGRGEDGGVSRKFCPGFDNSPNPVPGGPNTP